MAAKLLLKQENINLGYKGYTGLPILHTLMMRLDSSNIDIATQILSEIVDNVRYSDSIRQLDDYGLSVLDRFLCNKLIHCVDLDLSANAKSVLEKLLNVPGLVVASGKTLALAGTLCCPVVFKLLMDNGACPNDSLEGESTAHCVIARNSLLKCSYLLKSQVDLTTKWNGRDPVELARAYGCKKDIFQMLCEVQGKDPVTRGKGTNNSTASNCTCNSEYGKQFHLCEWAKFETYLSSKIQVNIKHIKNFSDDNRNALFAVKHNQHFMSMSSEINQMKHEIEHLFKNISESFSCSSALSHMAYEYTLRGSMQDNCKCFGPNEFDAVLTIKDQNMLKIDDFDIIPLHGSKWNAFRHSDGYLIVTRAAQGFYNAFAIQCQEYNADYSDRTTGIVQIIFQYMAKISRIKLLWKGTLFPQFKVYVDVVLAFTLQTEESLPFGLSCDSFGLIAKSDRHAYQEAYVFEQSYCEAESHIMKALPEPIRQGFITAKAVRLFGVCAPEFDMARHEIVEDTDIEEYITSHALKSCLLNMLQRVYETNKQTCDSDRKSDSMPCGNETITDTYCKYAIASYIINEFRSNIINKKMPIWHDQMCTLLNCLVEECSLEENVCCRKRKIKLALVENMGSWLNNKENLRYLHDGDVCNCAEKYSKEQLEYHNEFVTRLVETGDIFCELHSEIASQKGNMKIVSMKISRMLEDI